MATDAPRRLAPPIVAAALRLTSPEGAKEKPTGRHNANSPGELRQGGPKDSELRSAPKTRSRSPLVAGTTFPRWPSAGREKSLWNGTCL
jgi:hypothetical protein